MPPPSATFKLCSARLYQAAQERSDTNNRRAPMGCAHTASAGPNCRVGLLAALAASFLGSYALTRATSLLCRREISEDVSRLVETTDEFERPQSAPPLFADGISGGFALVRAVFLIAMRIAACFARKLQAHVNDSHHQRTFLCYSSRMAMGWRATHPAGYRQQTHTQTSGMMSTMRSSTSQQRRVTAASSCRRPWSSARCITTCRASASRRVATRQLFCGHLRLST
jgi:hypothetical protein